MKHIAVVIDRATIPPEIGQVEFTLELSFDGGATWDQDFIADGVCYSHKLGGTADSSLLRDFRNSTEASRGTYLPDGVEVQARASCTGGVVPNIVYE